MRKIFTIAVLAIWFYLCMCVIVNAQSKPRNPIAPSGNWADSLQLAWAFSPDDSANGTAANGINDWSGNGKHGSATSFGPANWTTQSSGSESPLWWNAGNGELDGKTGWNSIITDKFTLVQRLKLTSNGSTWDSFSWINGTDIKAWLGVHVQYNGSMSWNVTTSGSAAKSFSNTYSNNTFTTIICEYGGDSIRVWQDNVYKGATVQTGNISLGANHALKFGVSYHSPSFRYWFGAYAMGCAWNRELTSAERDAIWCDPYVMFRSSSPCFSVTSRRRWIVQSMLPEPSVAFIVYAIFIASAIGTILGIYWHFFYQRRSPKR
jgi:hypothetical protein